jgi:hypothetical protein
VTYGGVNVPRIASAVDTVDEVGRTYYYYLGSGLPAGAQTIVVTVSGAATKRPGAWAVTAAADTEVVDTQVVEADAANPSVTLLLGGRTSFCCVGFYSGQNAVTGITPFSGWTSNQEHDFGNFTGGWYRYNTIGSADVTAGFTQTSDDCALIAAAVSEVVSGTTLTPSAVAGAFSVAAATLAGALTLSPAAIAGMFAVAVPNLVKGVVTILPAAVAAAWGVFVPTVDTGGDIVTPTPVGAAFSVTTLTMLKGPVVLTPAAAAALFGVAAPLLIEGAVTLTPNPAVGVFSVQAVTIPGEAGGVVRAFRVDLPWLSQRWRGMR